MLYVGTNSKEPKKILLGDKNVKEVWLGHQLVWPSQAAFDGKVKKVAVGGNHVLVLLANGTVWSAGFNSFGQLCRNVESGSAMATNFGPIPGVDDATDISAGNSCSCMIRGAGQVWTAGWNEAGNLCRNVESGSATATNFGQVPGVNDATGISMGSNSIFIIRNRYQVWNAGNNDYGQLCRNVDIGSATATNFGQVPGINDVVSVANGTTSVHIHMLNMGQIWNAGHNVFGQLCRNVGTGSATATNFGPIPDVDDVTQISAAAFSTFMYRAMSSQIWSAGHNHYGQLCRNVESGSATATNFGPIPGVDDVVSIAAGTTHTLVLRFGGQVWNAGFNDWGQLCRNVESGSAMATNFGPIPGVDDAEDARNISVGDDVSFILRSDDYEWNGGTVWNAGENYYGQLCRNVDTGGETATNFGQV